MIVRLMASLVVEHERPAKTIHDMSSDILARALYIYICMCSDIHHTHTHTANTHTCTYTVGKKKKVCVFF